MLVIKARSCSSTGLSLHVDGCVICVICVICVFGHFCRSCRVDGTSRWAPWCFPSGFCSWSHNWSWTSGSIWMEPWLRVRSFWGLNSRWETQPHTHTHSDRVVKHLTQCMCYKRCCRVIHYQVIHYCKQMTFLAMEWCNSSIVVNLVIIS